MSLEAIWNWDREVFRWIHLAAYPGVAGSLWSFISILGLAHVQGFPLLIAWSRVKDRPALTLGLTVFFGAIVFAYGADEGQALPHLFGYVFLWLALNRLDPKIAKQCLTAFAVGGIIHILLKEFMVRERPSNFIWAHPLENVYSTPAFPSGHTTTSFAIGLMLFLLLPHRGFGVLALTLGILVGISRIAVGVHWPTDVIGGWALGALAVGIARMLGLMWESRESAGAAAQSESHAVE